VTRAPNWFIALPVSGAEWLEALPRPPGGIRGLGAVGELRARAAWDALAWPLGERVVTLDRVVPMGPPGRYSALSATLGAGREEVEAAITRSRAVLYAVAGTRPDERPARAHVTVARPTRRATESDRHHGLAWAADIRLEEPRITLDSVALYTWASDRSQALFEVVERRGLELRGGDLVRG